ncbi:hypothetical protein [Synechocystis sp. LKSZ1]|uniref:glycosyltransferase family 39 protein n=1 Tax=Synechocystis sp. LKSZ1 TaxID=3144951 RepID=UPI00336BC809
MPLRSWLTSNLGLLIGWTLLGAWLRFQNLTDKPPWTDEFATLVFSLGNVFSTIPPHTALSSSELLTPLQTNPTAQVSTVIDLILEQDNHPPLYFALAHLWLRLFPTSTGLVNLWAARALPALIGVAAIPLGYAGMRWLGKSAGLAHSLALLMALSPYAIFIAQEARHYTLAVLLVLLSLGCFLKGSQCLLRGQRLPPSLVFAWVLVNSLALSVHFFTGLLLTAQGLTLLLLWYWPSSSLALSAKAWRSLLPVVLGTLAALLYWAWMISQRGYGNGMTDWIRQDNSSFSNLIGPPFQLLAALITMVCLFPVESSSLGIVILSGVGMLLYLLWLGPKVWQGLQQSHPQHPEIRLLGLLLGSLIFLYLGITYFGGMDITRGARYSFNFLPIVIGLLAFGLDSRLFSSSEQNPLPKRPFRHPTVLIVISVGLISGLTITHNLGYQKYYRPEQLLQALAENPGKASPLIVTTQQSLVQVGEMMGLAWQIQQTPALPRPPRFVLIPQTRLQSPQAGQQLKQFLAAQTQSLDLWLVNFLAPVDLPTCQRDPRPVIPIHGYHYERFSCPRPAKVTSGP